MTISILVCFAAFLALLSLLRRDKISLGLPLAYMFQLLLIHVPGAFAHFVSGDLLADSDLTAIGIRLTAIGSICYVAGVWLARSSAPKLPIHATADRRRFCLFCVLGGWGVTYGLGFLRHFASIGALIEQGGFIWMLGVMLGLRNALQRGNRKWIGIWLASLVVYPALMLVLGGFMSWGSMTAIIVLSAITVSTRNYRRVATGFAVVTFLGLSVFVNYFQHRTDIRRQVWGGASIEDRVTTILAAFTNFEWFDSANQTHLNALDQRLNQNYFVGLAAARLQTGDADYLYGATIWDGVLAVIPRALWPEKPIAAGSGRIVANMTGLDLAEGVSFGVGNVMEFYVNFGMPGIIIGFLLLGWVTGALDLKAAVAERQSSLDSLILYFLPAVALMSPIGSLVDLCSAFAAGLIAALGWSQLWKQLSANKMNRRSNVVVPRDQGYFMQDMRTSAH
jgi:hypothetical protein